MRRLGMVKRAFGRPSRSHRFLFLSLFKTHVRPLLEFACSAWVGAGSSTLRLLDGVQHKALLFATGAMRDTSLDALEALTGVMPLAHRRLLLARDMIAKIKREGYGHPLLFLLFVDDCIVDYLVKLGGFADDITAWEASRSLEEACIKLTEELCRLGGWARKWRSFFNEGKCLTTLFTKRPGFKDQHPEVFFQGSLLVSTPTPRLLGVFFDPRLTFKGHLEKARRKAMQRLGLIKRAFGRPFRSRRGLFISLYKIYVRPFLEFACAAFLGAPPTYLKTLDSVQHRALVFATGAHRDTSLDALEALTGVMPLRHRRSKLARNLLAKIKREPPSSVTKTQFEEWVVKFPRSKSHRDPSSFFRLANKVFSDEGFDVDPSRIETTIHPSDPDAVPPWRLPPRRDPPPFWSSFGSSNNRTKEQALQARLYATNLLHPDHIQCFTDGARLGDAVGAGALVSFPCGQSLELSQPLGQGNGGNGLGEFFAIKLALEAVISHLDQACVCVSSVSVCSLFSDSQAAVRVVGLGGSSRSFPRLAGQILRCVRQLREEFGVAVEFHWIPGHAGIEGNEVADRLAGESAQRALDLGEGQSMVRVGLAVVRAWVHKKCVAEWLRDWLNSDNGSSLRRFKKSVSSWDHLDVGLASDAALVTRLVTGHNCLNQPLFDQNRPHHTTDGSPDCPFCVDLEETEEHFVLECPTYNDLRQQLHLAVRKVSPTVVPSRLDTFFGGAGLSKKIKEQVQVCFQRFVRGAFGRRRQLLEIEPD